MRRLTRGRWSRLSTRDGERGGIAVATALLLPMFLGLAALGVDTAGVWAARQQVVNGADAAVLAVAMDCAAGSCGDIKATSEKYFFANDEAAKLADLKAGSGWIYVHDRQVRTTSTWLVEHFFAGALGYPTGELEVESTAAWTPAPTATSGVAFALSWCAYRAAVDANPVGRSSGSSTLTLRTDVTGSCSAPTGSGTVTAGTAWTAPTAGAACGTQATAQSTITVAPPAAGCSSAYLAGLTGTTVDIPVWDQVTGTGATQTYRVYGWASFRVTSVSSASPPIITGSFVWHPTQVGAPVAPGTTAPDLGARSVYLTDPSTWTGQSCRDGDTSC